MANLLKLPVILNFVNGSMPSEGDKKASEKYDGKAKVVYRNARAVEATDALELCDGVMGAVPPRYKEKYPTVDEAINAYESDKKELTKRVGDEPAPVAPKVTNTESEPVVAAKPASTTEKKQASVWKGGK